MSLSIESFRQAAQTLKLQLFDDDMWTKVEEDLISGQFLPEKSGGESGDIPFPVRSNIMSEADAKAMIALAGFLRTPNGQDTAKTLRRTVEALLSDNPAETAPSDIGEVPILDFSAK